MLQLKPPTEKRLEQLLNVVAQERMFDLRLKRLGLLIFVLLIPVFTVLYLTLLDFGRSMGVFR